MVQSPLIHLPWSKGCQPITEEMLQEIEIKLNAHKTLTEEFFLRYFHKNERTRKW